MTTGRNRCRGWSAAAAVMALMMLVPVPAVGGDFDTESVDWHGLSDFVALLEGQGIEQMETDVLDWREVSPQDVIVVVYPEQTPDVAGLAAFLSDGGRVLLADDFGASAPLAERLGIERQEPPADEMPHETFVDDYPGWPVFEPPGEHPLLAGVDQVVANYAAVFEHPDGPVIGYDEEGGFVYDMRLGEGRAVLVADPGILINSMLPVADNRRFVLNATNYLCEQPEGCRMWLLIGDVEFDGEYQTTAPEDEAVETLAERVQTFNQNLREVLEELPGSEVLVLVVLFLALGVVAYLLTLFRWRRAKRLSRYIHRESDELAAPMTEFGWNVKRFTDGTDNINHALPMAILKESFEELFFQGLGLSPEEMKQAPSAALLAKRFEQRYLQEEPVRRQRSRRRQVKQLLEMLQQVPPRQRVFLESEHRYTARELAQAHRQIRRVLGWMGLKEAYERRTREIEGRVLRSR